MNGQEMYRLAEELFPICRSITGKGTRDTLSILNRELPQITIHNVPTGTAVFDWSVPKEWVIRDAYVETLSGEKIIDFKKTNLHVLGYSAPIDKVVSKEELLKIVYTLPDQPDLIPYVTSYYKERIGICMSENMKNSLSEDQYHVVVDSEFIDGNLTYGELIIPGETDEEIFFSTYVCHPSMANNELSGPVVCTALAKYIQSIKRRYTYRFVFIPETIGSITYLSKNLEYLQQHVIAGFNISCVGDDRTYSYIESPYADNLADRVVQNVLSFHYPEYKRYTFMQRGSDERQYCSPLVNLPMCAVCRSKYEEYPEYHTSADNLSVISPEGLQGAFDMLRKCIDLLEYNNRYRITVPCEPQLGKRGLYPTISYKGSHDYVNNLTAFIAYSTGSHDLIDISNRIKADIDTLKPIIEKCLLHQLIEKV
ncbi:MAG: DUF4910 domain-containing protein [Prevotellaceae bacterium]|nr:DUF4910 domain-containing protein [Candidatus Colivivens equi]